MTSRIQPPCVRNLATLIVTTSVCAFVPTRAGGPDKPPELIVPVRILVADCPSAEAEKHATSPVRNAAWVHAHVTAAKRILAPHGIVLRETIVRFAPDQCDLLTRGARHSMARFVQMDGPATVLIVRRIRDLDVPSYNLMGVHWRYRGHNKAHRGRRWVFLTARARPPVLAHELGHYFGLRHDPKGGNLMAPGPSSPLRTRPAARKLAPFAPILTPAQAKKMRANIAREMGKGT